MGRHSATEGAGVDPLVAAALRLRATAAAGTPGSEPARRTLAAAVDEGELGWPGEPGDGTGLGWPVGEPGGAAGVADQPETAVPRRGWRRLFSSPAA